MTPKEFLVKEGLMKEEMTEFIISFEDGRSFNLIDLLKDYSSIISGIESQIRENNIDY